MRQRFDEFLQTVASKEHVYPPLELYQPLERQTIADAWADFVDQCPDHPLGIYLHVPFCVKKCSFCYCDTIITDDADQIETYVEGLRNEIREMGQLLQGAEVRTVYLGGGTPTALPIDQLATVLDDLRQHFSLRDDVHLNVEATPYSMTAELARLLADHGTRRVTLGIQSNDPTILSDIGRPQSFEQVESAVEWLRVAGVSAINFDLVGGMPGDTEPRFATGFQRLLDLSPEMVHIYPFSPVRGMEDNPEKEAIVTKGRRMLEDAGYRPLRNDGFGRSDDDRNIQVIEKIEQAASCLGLGIRSRSHVFSRLAYRPTHYRDYLAAAKEGRPPTYWGTPIGRRTQIERFLMDNLKQGMRASDFARLFGVPALQTIEHLHPDVVPVLNVDGDTIGVEPDLQRGGALNRMLMGPKVIEQLYSHWIDQPRGWPEAEMDAARDEPPYAPDVNFARFMSTKLTKGIIYPPHGRGPTRLAAQSVMDAWTDLAQRIRSGEALERVGIYCHVPYCATKCTFCYCYTDELQSEDVLSRYVDAVERQMLFMAPLVEDIRFNSVYFGGGTPSILRPERLDSLLGTLFGHFQMTDDAQFNFEGTPNTLARGRLEVLLEHGMNRLTMGVQSLDRAVLEGIGRMQQSEKGVRELFHRARDAGVASINIDLVAGLPGQDFDSFHHDLEEVLDWRPDVLHVYPFSNQPDTTTFKTGFRMNTEKLEERSRMVQVAHEAIMNAGYLEVQNESYALRWDARNRQDAEKIEYASSVLGFGYQARSHVFGGASYGTYPADYQRFIDDPEHQELYYGSVIGLREDQIRFIMSNLREGFSRIHYTNLFGEDVLVSFWRPLVWLRQQGLVTITRTEVRSRIENRADQLTYSKLFWDDAHVAPLREAWKDEYQAEVDYTDALLAQVDPNF